MAILAQYFGFMFSAPYEIAKSKGESMGMFLESEK